MIKAADRFPARSLSLAGLAGPVVFGTGAERVADGLRQVLLGWPETGIVSGAEPSLVVRRRRGTFSVTRTRDGWISEEPTEISAVCTAVVEIVAESVAGRSAFGSHHAAAAEFAGRLVVFPATRRAGKSTLMTALAAAGRRVFADDLLPVDLTTLEGVATGCLPRLRLPLAEAAPPGLQAFVEAHTVASDGYYAYVGGEDLVAHGERAPIGAVVLLDRQDGPCSARLDPAGPDEALLGLMMQDARSAFPAGETLERYGELVSRAALHRLTYARLDDALACLDVAFSRWPDPVDRCDGGIAPPAARPLPQPRSGADGPLYLRSPHVVLKVVGSAAFLADRGGDDVHHLNAVGLGLWNLLEHPLDEEAVAEVFLGAFPDQPERDIRQDVATVLRRLLEAGLVAKVAP